MLLQTAADVTQNLEKRSGMIFFPDTNFFLHFRSPSEIPWHTVTTDAEVRLLICRTVQSELDRLKGDGNNRRAERARKAAGRIRQIILDDAAQVLRESAPRVVLDLAPRLPPGQQHPASLDLSQNDDRIVAEVLAHHRFTGEAAAVLTDDTGIMATARIEGLTCVPTPEDWRLPKEADDRDKRMSELERRVARMERSAPMLEVTTSSQGAPLSGPLTIRRVQYSPLNAATVEELVELLRRHFPIKKDFSRESDPKASRVAATVPSRTPNPNKPTKPFGVLDSISDLIGSVEWHPPTDGQIAKYQDEYAAWLERVRHHLTGLHELLPSNRGTAPLCVSLTNSGTVPAEGLVVDIEALGGLFLSEPSKGNGRDGKRTPPALPAAPIAPAWKAVHRSGTIGASMQDWTTGLADLVSTHATPFSRSLSPGAVLLPPHVDPVGLHAPRDPLKFHWREKSSRTLAKHWNFDCVEFRHGSEAELFDTLVVASSKKVVGSGAVRFRASARNLPQRVEVTVEVRVETSIGDTETAARGLMPET